MPFAGKPSPGKPSSSHHSTKLGGTPRSLFVASSHATHSHTTSSHNVSCLLTARMQASARADRTAAIDSPKTAASCNRPQGLTPGRSPWSPSRPSPPAGRLPARASGDTPPSPLQRCMINPMNTNNVHGNVREIYSVAIRYAYSRTLAQGHAADAVPARQHLASARRRR